MVPRLKNILLGNIDRMTIKLATKLVKELTSNILTDYHAFFKAFPHRNIALYGISECKELCPKQLPLCS